MHWEDEYCRSMYLGCAPRTSYLTSEHVQWELPQYWCYCSVHLWGEHDVRWLARYSTGEVSTAYTAGARTTVVVQCARCWLVVYQLVGGCTY